VKAVNRSKRNKQMCFELSLSNASCHCQCW